MAHQTTTTTVEQDGGRGIITTGDAPLNCIIDESALLAGLRDRTKDNIKHWIRDAAINAFIPLYTLERLSIIRDSGSATSNEARKALEWLDRITSSTDSRILGSIQLQGPDDLYQTWQEVEKYLLPDTPLSLELEMENYAEDLSIAMAESALDEDDTPWADNGSTKSHSKSPQQHTASSHASRQSRQPNGSSKADGSLLGSSAANDSSIPMSVRPLLNFVVWKTHNRGDFTRGNGQFILLTNDQTTQRQAQKFGVRAKMLAQVCAIVAKSTPRMQPTNGAHRPVAIEPLGPDEDFEEVVYKPNPRASPKRSSPRLAQNVLDPNHFGRNPKQDKSVGLFEAPISPRVQSVLPSASAGPAVTRSPNSSSRARSNTPNNRPLRQPQTPVQHIARPIDPDSYARPSPGGRRTRGPSRGRLWEPN